MIDELRKQYKMHDAPNIEVAKKFIDSMLESNLPGTVGINNFINGRFIEREISRKDRDELLEYAAQRYQEVNPDESPMP